MSNLINRASEPLARAQIPQQLRLHHRIMPEMLDGPDDLLDIIRRPALRHLAGQGVIRGPGGPFVVAARQTHAADVDDRLEALIEAIDP